MNYLALMEKLKNTDQFLNIEPAILLEENLILIY